MREGRLERHDVDVGGGLSLHAAVSGERGRSAVLLLHGFTGSGESWTPLRQTLDRTYRVVTIDMPGHGLSTVPVDAARASLDRFAGDAFRVLDALGIGTTAVLGYSMGGRAALSIAAAQPERITRLVLESTFPVVVDEDARRERQIADNALADFIEREGVDAFVDRWERLPLWESQKHLPREVREQLRLQRLANSARGLAASLRGASVAHSVPDENAVRSVTAQALIIAGEQDSKYVQLAGVLAKWLRSATVCIIPDAGHAVHLEQAVAFASAVTRFLAGAEPAEALDIA